MGKRKLKIGDTVSFKFAGQLMVGKILSIDVDKAYSVKTWWYKISSDDGYIYPLRVDNETIKQIKL